MVLRLGTNMSFCPLVSVAAGLRPKEDGGGGVDAYGWQRGEVLAYGGYNFWINHWVQNLRR